MTSIDSIGAVIIPPIIGAAIRLITSEPVPVPMRIGNKPARMTATVIAFGTDSEQGTFAHGGFDRLVVRLWPTLRERLFEVDQHHHAELGGTPANAMNPTPVATDWLYPSR